ncbi:Hypothetical predicted protein, partial [Marmota monax]
PGARPLGPKRLPPQLSVPLLQSTGPLAGGCRTTPEQALPEGAAANRPPRRSRLQSSLRRTGLGTQPSSNL